MGQKLGKTCSNNYTQQWQSPLPHTNTNMRTKSFKTKTFENKNINKPSKPTATEEIVNLDTRQHPGTLPSQSTAHEDLINLDTSENPPATHRDAPDLDNSLCSIDNDFLTDMFGDPKEIPTTASSEAPENTNVDIKLINLN